MNKRIGSDAKKLLLGDLIYILTGVFINTFLVAYFLQVTNDNITKIAIYYLIVHGMRFVGALVIGNPIKRNPETTKPILSLSVIVRAIFILFIVLLKENLASAYIGAAIIYALSEILYWAAHDNLYIVLTNKDNRKEYMALKKLLDKIINIVAPVVLGTSIEFTSFSKIAAYVFVFAVMQIIVTLLIKQPETFAEKRLYSVKAFKKKVYEENIDDVKNFAKAGLAFGIFEKSVSKIIIIITLMTFETQMNLGILTTVFSLCSMIAILIYSKLKTNKNSKMFCDILAVITVLSVIGLVLDINKTTLIIYNFCYMLGFGIYNLEYNVKKANIVTDNNLEEHQEEYIAYATAGLTIGRILGYVLLLIAGIFNNLIVFKVVLLLTTFAILGYTRYLTELDNHKATQLNK